MATQVQRRRGTASEHTTFTGAAGEVTVNTTNDSLHVHDGATAGGIELSRADGQNANMPTSAMPAGSVIQVVHATKNSVTSTTNSGSFTDITGMSVSITPSAASSKVLVMFSTNTSNSSSSQNDCIRLKRNATTIATGAGASTVNCTVYPREDDNAINQSSMTFLDSPATTSAVTYKLQWRPESGGTLFLNRRRTETSFVTISSITVMEIAG